MTLRTSRLTRIAAVGASALLASTLAVSPALAAEGDPAISYDAQTNTLTVGDGSGSTDLFLSFKGVVPGDTLTQDVAVNLENVSTPTRLYVRADASRIDAEAMDILDDNVTLSASFDEAPGVRPVSDAGTPFEVLASERGILVAEVTEPAETTLHLSLTVDVSAGNEVADLVTRIPWEIVVEEEDDAVSGGDEEEGTGGPLATTSDPLSYGIVIGVVVVGCGALMASRVVSSRNKRD